jgi:hypothetical protein
MNPKDSIILKYPQNKLGQNLLQVGIIVIYLFAAVKRPISPVPVNDEKKAKRDKKPKKRR